MRRVSIIYATVSEFKKAEIEAAKTVPIVTRAGSVLIGEKFDFQFSDAPTSEPLACDLKFMVRHKSISAYKSILAPCIVEHAGLIFEEYRATSYPGGLTQPMWDALGAEGFIRETSGGGRAVVAQSVIGYCDGYSVEIFVGECAGTLAPEPRGRREFYWDTVFCPSVGAGRTFAEICDESTLGIAYKVSLSQSITALKEFLSHRLRVGAPEMFPHL